MRTIKEVVEAIKKYWIYELSDSNFRTADDEAKTLNELCNEILEIHKAEKERIIKELEEATVIAANDFGQFECIPKWEAIEIVKGGKE